MATRPPGRTFVAHQAEPLDLTLWRLSTKGSGVVEAALAANPGLARSADALADGTTVFVPDAALDAPQVAPTVNLWD